MTGHIKYILSFFHLIIHLNLLAAPAPLQIAFQNDKRQCFIFFPGDENFSAYLKEPHGWKLYSEGFGRQILETSYGICDYTGSQLKDCCQKLNFRLLTDTEISELITTKSHPTYLTSEQSAKPDESKKNNEIVKKSDLSRQSNQNTEINQNSSYNRFSKIWIFCIVLLNIIILFLLIKKIKIFSKLKIFELNFLVYAYPNILAGLVFIFTYKHVVKDPHTNDLLVSVFAPLIMASYSYCISLPLVTICLLLIRYELRIIAFIVILFSFYLSTVPVVTVHQVNKALTNLELIAGGDANINLASIQNQIGSFPKQLSFDNIKPYIDIGWIESHKITVTNKFPIKIYMTLNLKNPQLNTAAKYDPQIESCQLLYQQELKPLTTIQISTQHCLFPGNLQKIDMRITSDVGYSAQTPP